jgi:hypothetical protein
MIKIINQNLDKIALDYSIRIKAQCKDRALFFQNIIDVIYNGNPLNSVQVHHLHGNIRKSIANTILLDANKITSSNNFSNAIHANLKPWVNLNITHINNILTSLANDAILDGLITKMPQDLLDLEVAILNGHQITPAVYQTIKPIINTIINYNLFDYFAYEIGTNLEINTCPYCNRVYINTVINKKTSRQIIRPTFDHFFSQKEHPLLALSFYNLIPSCYYCNSNLKGDYEMSLTTHLHPYLDGFDNDFNFNILIKDIKPDISHPDNYHIYINTRLNNNNPKFIKVLNNNDPNYEGKDGNVNLFKLNAIYQSHTDIVGEIVLKCDKLSKGHSDSLHYIFGLLKTNKVEFYRYYFSNYFNELDFKRRPLAKLTKDIVTQVLPFFIK